MKCCKKIRIFRGGAVIDATPYLQEICDEYSECVLKRYGVNLEDDFLDFSGVKSVNFYKESKEIWSIFSGTYGEEILPSVYKDDSLAIDGPYEIGNLNVSVNPGDVVFDAGANLGLFCCYAASKGCKVYAFDPDKTSVDYLKKQQRLYPEIEVVPVGLSNETGKQSFYEAEACALSSMSGRFNGIKREIQVDTIDHYVKSKGIDRIDYIKADIEGEERNMLKGATDVLKTMHPKLAICTYHYAEDPMLLEQIIKDANPNYVVNHLWRKLYAYVP